MAEEQAAWRDGGNVGVQSRYFIDLDWYRAQERSFITLVASRLCSSSHDKKAVKSESALLNTLKQCCSKQQSFATPGMPILELVFRIFLANGNQPLDLEQLQDKLQQWLTPTDSPRDLAITKLERIIDNDSYYGLRRAPFRGQID